MSKETLTKSIREIPDFPIPGILFYDVTTLFKEPTALQDVYKSQAVLLRVIEIYT